LWYHFPDTAWYAYRTEDQQIRQLTSNELGPFYDELNDSPTYPYPEGIAGWTSNDQFVVIQDRYDLWLMDPAGVQAPRRLTDGREQKRTYRYIRLDPEERHLPDTPWTLHFFDEESCREGYAQLLWRRGELRVLRQGDARFARQVVKARDAEQYLFTRETFREFPDLRLANSLDGRARVISDANPQQERYRWGTIEHYYWTSLDGQRLRGLLVKPDDFDPGKKYPLIVNFYERSSDGLHRHRRPEAHRSTINYSHYVSQGYIIFNPDVPYRIGYPGESAFNAVTSGVTALLAEGYIDPARIGVQGHSWGCYQIAHLLTRTDLFRCAESGAPVVNMFSAYGGIRWGSGMSRQFQYERTQSRIGGTPWEYPLRYMENSPLFFMDKVNTPVLILHNDEDGAVPWYQGIEYFTALRRLGKPAWLLNYNGEPHWPLKWYNRIDFQRRLSQFFNYYLLDEPQPRWMVEGVSPLQKGIEQGYEAVEEE
jgi:dipeptidyl aminopeptidase/acylaminoacyl peptidase